MERTGVRGGADRRGGGDRAGGGGEPGVEAALDELYTTPPSAFVPRREELAAAARTDGRKEDARRIHAARRPTLAAWAANLLRHGEPEETERFLELGRALREAYATLDPGGLKELNTQRRRIVSELSREAGRLARDAGHRLSDAVLQDVETTLRAVLADTGAADEWATGRLTNALTPPSAFPSGTSGAPTPQRPSARSATAAAPSGKAPSSRARRTDELAERREEAARRKQREERLARARAEAEAAARRLRERRAEREEAASLLERAGEEHHAAEQRVSAAERELREAREELERAEHGRREAGERSRTAEGALARAEREAREAARRAERLAAGGK
ncbi:hypothetical protein ACFYOV_32195 [Streptomyces sp. NPDC005931]|uniref:hypothetical protein n=1 Tax=Streptomyces sp. NPDC005931 TaxID=3364737 RepID=UPI0036AF32B4